jgi:uncharacterized protein involved in exopolysaccharide biosynthesis
MNARTMNAVIQHRDEVDVPNVEATEAKIDGLRGSLDETKQDVRELRGEIRSLSEKVDRHHGEMHAGFAALRKTMDDMSASLRAEIAGVQTSLRAEIGGLQTSLRSDIAAIQQNVAGLRATVKTVFWGFGAVATMAMIFFAAGKALKWF